MTFSRPQIGQTSVNTTFSMPNKPGVISGGGPTRGPVGDFTYGRRSGPGGGLSLGSAFESFFDGLGGARGLNEAVNGIFDRQADKAMAEFFNANPGMNARAIADDPAARAAFLQMDPRARRKVALALTDVVTQEAATGYASALALDEKLQEGPGLGADPTQFFGEQRRRKQEIYQEQLEAAGFGVLAPDLQAVALRSIAPSVGRANAELRRLQAVTQIQREEALEAQSGVAMLMGSIGNTVMAEGLQAPRFEVVDIGGAAIDVEAVPVDDDGRWMQGIPDGGDAPGALKELPPPPPVASAPPALQLPPPEGIRQARTGDINPNAGPLGELLGRIRSAEGSWESVNRGEADDTPGGYKGLSNMTVAQVMRLQRQGYFAVGAYQFIPGTLQMAVKSAGLNPETTKFDPETQTRLAVELILGGQKRPALTRYLNGQSDDLQAAVREVSLEWAGVKGPGGRGAYDDDKAGNMASVAVEDLLPKVREQVMGGGVVMGRSGSRTQRLQVIAADSAQAKAAEQQAQQQLAVAKENTETWLNDRLETHGWRGTARLTARSVQGMLTELGFGYGNSAMKAQRKLAALERIEDVLDASEVRRGQAGILDIPYGENGETLREYIRTEKARQWAASQDDISQQIQTRPDLFQLGIDLATGQGSEAERAAKAQELIAGGAQAGLDVFKLSEFARSQLAGGQQLVTFEQSAEVQEFIARRPVIMDPRGLTIDQLGDLFQEIVNDPNLSVDAKRTLAASLRGNNSTDATIGIGLLERTASTELVQDINTARNAMLQGPRATDAMRQQKPEDFAAQYRQELNQRIIQRFEQERAESPNQTLTDQDRLRISNEVRTQYLQEQLEKFSSEDPALKTFNQQYQRALSDFTTIKQGLVRTGGVMTPEVFPERYRKTYGNDVRRMERAFTQDLDVIRNNLDGTIRQPFKGGKWYGGQENVLKRLQREATEQIRREQGPAVPRSGPPQAPGVGPVERSTMPNVPFTPAGTDTMMDRRSSVGGMGSGPVAIGGVPTGEELYASVDSKVIQETVIADSLVKNLGVVTRPRAADDDLVAMDPGGVLRGLINRSGIPALKDLIFGKPMKSSTPPLPQMEYKAKTTPMSTVIEPERHPVAVAIGIAEGTRTRSGARTAAWYGHPDPLVPGRTNIGTYSASSAEFSSPEAADAAWSKRLSKKAAEVSKILRGLGLTSDMVGYQRIMFAAADLEVQAPAANREDGFIGKLAEVVKNGATMEAIAKARADSFYNPRTGKLETGFGSYERLLADQRRRVAAFDLKQRVN